jgi:ribonuclease HII
VYTDKSFLLPEKLVYNGKMKGRKYIVGIDEAGRGPLAGPVSVAGVLFEKKSVRRLERLFLLIKGKDSKKLNEKQRDFWFEVIQKEERAGNIKIAHFLISETHIDTKGIVSAVFLGLEKSLKKLEVVAIETEVLLDGALRAPKEYIYQKTIIRGDETELSIRLASIVAKVTRDKKMVQLAKKYPEYGFEKHKGYGTKEHQKALGQFGLCEIHRKTFIHFEKNY